MVYQWRTEGFYNCVSAQDAGEEIERCMAADGHITPESIVDKARIKSSVLHSLFEWDNTQAAKLYRIEQARALIRNIVTVTVFSEVKADPIAPVRAFVHIVDGTVKGYKTISTVINSPHDYNYMMICACQELIAFTRKYGLLSQLGGKMSARINPLITAIDEFLKNNDDPEV